MKKEQTQIVLEQLGGTAWLKLMIGAKDFTFDHTGETGFRFKFECSSVAIMVEIKLENDLYTMNFYKIVPLKIIVETGSLKINREADFEPVASFAEIYNDRLIDIFEETTKLIIRRINLVTV